MTTIKLIFRNVKKNLKDYLIYFLTLTISISVFYAFNILPEIDLLGGEGVTSNLLFKATSEYLGLLSIMISAILGFLIVYANKFILKRRKKELGIYTLLGMKKRKISFIFTGETILIGLLSLFIGLILGVILSQVLVLITFKLFAISIEKYEFIISINAIKSTFINFSTLFIVVILFNIRSINKVKLIDLITAERKNDEVNETKDFISLTLFILSIMLLVFSGLIFEKYGIIPSRDNYYIQAGFISVILGTYILFYVSSSLLVKVFRKKEKIYFKNLNVFFFRQIAGKMHTNYIILATISLLLSITICAISLGMSMTLTINDMNRQYLPYDLNIVDIKENREENIKDRMSELGVDIDVYSSKTEQISYYEANIKYKDIFKGQEIKLWRLDQDLPDNSVWIISESDYNRAMKIQGKDEISLGKDQYLMNSNYKGTLEYIKNYYNEVDKINIDGKILEKGSNEVLRNTIFMTSVGNNDRGTIVVPDNVVENLDEIYSVLLVQYRENITSKDTNELIQKLVPIGLDDSLGYRYSEKNMQTEMHLGMSGGIALLGLYIGIVFLLISVTLLALKQLTETSDNIYSYNLIQKMGASVNSVSRTLFKQIGIFFLLPLFIASLYSAFGLRYIIKIAEDFLNMSISTNISITVAFFLVIYLGYFLVTYTSCKKIIKEKN